MYIYKVCGMRLTCAAAAKLTANGTVKTFGVGGPNVLDMIGD